jgi:threonyl-tRNA synthetase
LFTIDDAGGAGAVLWKPKGAIVRQELQNFICEHLRRQGYHQVFTPHIGRLGSVQDFRALSRTTASRSSRRWSIAS